VTRLEQHYAGWDGLNLTWEALEGIAKHNGPVTGDIPWALAEYVARQSVADIRAAGVPVIRFSEALWRDLKEIRAFLFRRMYRAPSVVEMRARVTSVVRDLFPIYMQDPALLPEGWRGQIGPECGEVARARLVSDYIAGMTDRFALQEHARLIGQGGGEGGGPAGRWKMNLFTDIRTLVLEKLAEMEAEGALPAGLERGNVSVEPPRDAAHGDMATNAAMVLARPAGKKPREIAGALAEKLAGDARIEVADVAGPGFINLRLAPAVWQGVVKSVLETGRDFGRSEMGRGPRARRGVRRRAGEPSRFLGP